MHEVATSFLILLLLLLLEPCLASEVTFGEGNDELGGLPSLDNKTLSPSALKVPPYHSSQKLGRPKKPSSAVSSPSSPRQKWGNLHLQTSYDDYEGQDPSQLPDLVKAMRILGTERTLQASSESLNLGDGIPPTFQTIFGDSQHVDAFALKELKKTLATIKNLSFENSNEIPFISPQALSMVKQNTIAGAESSELKYILKTGTCHGARSASFKYLTIENAPMITSDCVKRMIFDGEAQIPDKVVPFMPEDCFGYWPSAAIAPFVYKSMTEMHLYHHILMGNVPSVAQMQNCPAPIAVHVLAKVIHKRPSIISASLLKLIPKELMHLLGRKFWESFDPETEWSLTDDQLFSLPPNAFVSAHPNALNTLSFPDTKTYPKLEKWLSELLSRVGRRRRPDGTSSCQAPTNMIKSISKTLLRKLPEACIVSILPEYFHAFADPEKLDALSARTVELLSAEQVANLPEGSISDLCPKFIKNLNAAAVKQKSKNEKSVVACSGMRAQHIAHIKNPALWKLFKFECVFAWEGGLILPIPEMAFKNLPAKLFHHLEYKKVIEDAPEPKLTTSVISKMSPVQIVALPTMENEDYSGHLCENLKIDWNKIGGASNCATVVRMPAFCFAILNFSTYSNMEEGALRKMDDNILEYIKDSDRLAAIPVRAFSRIRSRQLAFIKPSAMRLLTMEHLQMLIDSGLAKKATPQTWHGLRFDNFLEMVGRGLVLRDDALSTLGIQNLTDSSWIGTFGEVISWRTWNSLGRNASWRLGQFSPCSLIEYENVELQSGRNKTKFFWMGINEVCFASLNFLPLLSKEELALVSDSAFRKISETQREKLAEILGSDSYRLEVGADCILYTPEHFSQMPRHHFELLSAGCIGQLKPEILGGLPDGRVKELPQDAFSKIRRLQVVALTGRTLGQITAAQWSLFGSSMSGISCAGFSPEQAAFLPLDSMSPACIEFLVPEVFAALTPHQLDLIPTKAWESSIGRSQVAVIDPSSFAQFRHFGSFGLKWPQTKSMHPCLGITVLQKQSMSPTTAKEYKKACSTVFVSTLPESDASSTSPPPFTIQAVMISVAALFYIAID